MSVYLDYNATAPIRAEAQEAVRCALAIGGNPSSVHAAGRLARGVIETARADVARLVGATSAAVTFTSGGTEANVSRNLQCGCGRDREDHCRRHRARRCPRIR